MASPILALDANIIIHAVLGTKVGLLILKFSNSVDFFIPDICIQEAEKHLTKIFEKHNIPAESCLKTLEKVTSLLKIIDHTIYEEYIAAIIKRKEHCDAYE